MQEIPLELALLGAGCFLLITLMAGYYVGLGETRVLSMPLALLGWMGMTISVGAIGHESELLDQEVFLFIGVIAGLITFVVSFFLARVGGTRITTEAHHDG